ERKRSYSGPPYPHPERAHGPSRHCRDAALEDEDGGGPHPQGAGLRQRRLREGRGSREEARGRAQVRPRRTPRDHGPPAHEPAGQACVPQADEHSPRPRRARGGYPLDLARDSHRSRGPQGRHRRRSPLLRLL
ncbi:MAG: SSU ribosomal protein S8p (S15Ae), partial [uncultured Rubrobacteraceae bacterium]